MNDDQIKHMVNRFLGWRLPESFNPDGGISVKKTFNGGTPHAAKYNPSGTNLFDATQADAMVRYMVEGLPAPTPPVAGEDARTEMSHARKRELIASVLEKRYLKVATNIRAGMMSSAWPEDLIDAGFMWNLLDAYEAAQPSTVTSREQVFEEAAQIAFAFAGEPELKLPCFSSDFFDGAQTASVNIGNNIRALIAQPAAVEVKAEVACGWKFNGFGPCTLTKGHEGVHGKRPTPQPPTIDDIDRAVIAVRKHIIERGDGLEAYRLGEPIEEEEREFVRIVLTAAFGKGV